MTSLRAGLPRLLTLHVGLAMAGALGAFAALGERSALAKVPCETEGAFCMVGTLEGSCVRDPDNALSCLATSPGACPGASEGAPCVVFEDDEGVCTRLRDRVICVPNAPGSGCGEAAFQAACVRPDGDVGVCFPAEGLLSCVADPDGCLVAEIEARCVTADGLDAWCREADPGFVCTDQCAFDGDDTFCRGSDGTLGECRRTGEAGLISCIANPSACPAVGDPCVNTRGEADFCVVGEYEVECGDPPPCGRTCPDGPNGEPGRCEVSGGAGTPACTYDDDDDDDGSGCCGGPQSPSAAPREGRGRVVGALGLLGLGLLGRRRGRRSGARS